MYESISKNNELENEMTLDMSYFWYSDKATGSGMLWIQPGCLFVGIGHFDHSSNTDRLMKSKLRASFPTNYTKSDTRASSII